ncbi:MAG: amidase, partial [Acetobacteraceae bacterium]|nr:amidase [Acetobacteraceae bacterium]
MTDADLLFMSAARAAALIRGAKLSPVAYVNAVLDGIERANPRLNAFSHVMANHARRSATAAEQAVRRGDPLGPLHGVPVSIKDLVEVEGVPFRRGSAIFADAVGEKDDITVQRLRAAGAIVIGKTTTPEFGVKALTDGPSFGITRNPWNPEHTPGGSSGGAAAAVAAGLGPLGLGTDGAGSIRGPAACCGLVGLKPTLGVVAREDAADALGNTSYAGPITRTVTDAALMHAVLAGDGSPAPLSRDPWAITPAPQGRVRPLLIGAEAHGLRVGYFARCANPRVAADVTANTQAMLADLAALGADIEEVTAPFDWAEPPGRVLYQAGIAVGMAKYLPQWQNHMDPVTLAFAQRGARFTLAEWREAEWARTILFRAVQGLFAQYDMLVMPTIARTALPVGHDAANDQVMVDGVP